MEYTYIPTGIKSEMVRSGVDCCLKGQVVGTVGRRPVLKGREILFGYLFFQAWFFFNEPDKS